MEKKQAGGAMVVVGAVMFAAGFLARMAWDKYEEKQADFAVLSQEAGMTEKSYEITAELLAAEGYLNADVLQIRIDDGQVQWYDGRLWHETASVEALEKQDRYYLAEEAFREFEETMAQERMAKRQEEALEMNETAVLVGQKEEPKPTAKPKAPVVIPQVPAEPETPAATPVPDDNSWNDSSQGTGSGGNDNPPAEEPPQNSDGGDNVNPPAEEPPQDSGGSDTGDGEDLEWTDDYL